MITCSKRALPLAVDFCRAGDAHIAARSTPVAPQGEIQTLGEHGLLCGDLGQHARHGAHIRGSIQLVVLSPAARTRRRSRASPYSPMAPDWPRCASDPTTIAPPNLFCQQR